MIATLRSFIAVLLVRTMAGARSRRKTGTHFSGSRSKPEILFRVSMIFAENRFPLFRIMPEGRLAPKKEARPKGPGKPYSLRRNIVRNRGKTTRKLILLRKN